MQRTKVVLSQVSNVTADLETWTILKLGGQWPAGAMRTLREFQTNQFNLNVRSGHYMQCLALFPMRRDPKKSGGAGI